MEGRLNFTAIEKKTTWADELSAIVKNCGLDVKWNSSPSESDRIIFIDAELHPRKVLGEISRKGKAIFLVTEHGDHLPESWAQGLVDDVLVRPFRAIEVASKIRHSQQILMWDEIQTLSNSFSEMMERFKDDLLLADRLQKRKIKESYPEVKGFKVFSRYLVGERSGGDHFDLTDRTENGDLSLTLSDSTSYGLSSAVLSVLMSAAIKLSSRSSQETVQSLYGEIAAALGEKDHLSLFYGKLSRRDLCLRYVNLGTSCALHAKKGQPFTRLPRQGNALAAKSESKILGEESISLEKGDRIVLVSDGIIESVGNEAEVIRLFDKYRSQNPKDSLSEVTYQVKRKLGDEDSFPKQDCTAVIMDVDTTVLRLAKG